MKPVEIEAPGIVKYRVNTCPYCGKVPNLHVDIYSHGKEKIEYSLKRTVTCPQCGIIAPLEKWNRLSYLNEFSEVQF